MRSIGRTNPVKTMTNPQEMTEAHAIVRGCVQGVGFRATTQYHANQLQLTGTVRNLSDGSVEIYAHGLKSSLESLFSQLEADPGFGKIQSIDTDYSPPKREFPDFDILF